MQAPMSTHFQQSIFSRIAVAFEPTESKNEKWYVTRSERLNRSFIFSKRKVTIAHNWQAVDRGIARLELELTHCANYPVDKRALAISMTQVQERV
jgi:hypothetical protein